MTDETKLNILLADDDEEDCLLFKEALEESGHNCPLEVVHDGDQLMYVLEGDSTPSPDILFLDLDMPCKSGMACLEEIRLSAKLKSLPIVIFTTHKRPETVKKAYEGKAQFYLRKPNSFLSLVNAIDIVLNTNWTEMVQPGEDEFLIDCD